MAQGRAGLQNARCLMAKQLICYVSPSIARAHPATMDIMPFTLRRATVADADAIAEVYSASFRLLTFLPILHTAAEYRSFIANVILRDCEGDRCRR